MVGLVVCASSIGSAQTADEQMKKDIEALKAGQQAIQKDLAEIKRLLQSRPRGRGCAAQGPDRHRQRAVQGQRHGQGRADRVLGLPVPVLQPLQQGTSAPDRAPTTSTPARSSTSSATFRSPSTSRPSRPPRPPTARARRTSSGRCTTRLFQNQTALAPEQLATHAKTLGLDEPEFQQCLDTGKFAADINKDIADAGAAGITGTPRSCWESSSPDGRVKVVKKLSGAKPYAEFKAAIDSALGAP